MPSRAPGGDPDPAADLLGRWAAHHTGTPDSAREAVIRDAADDAPTSSAVAEDEATDAEADPTQARPTTNGEAVATPRHAAPWVVAARRRPASARGADQTEAGREVVEAFRDQVRQISPPSGVDTPSSPAPAAAPAHGLDPGLAAAIPPAPEAPAGASPWPRRSYTPPAVEGSTDVEFAPRQTLRQVLAVLLLVAVLATCVAGYVANEEPTTLTLGVAATLGVVTLLLYGVRASSAPARLAIRSGQLEVVRGSTREVFDLTSRFTRMEVVGSPGRRGWKVLMARFGRDPLVIDASMVDPVRFTAAIERHRLRQSG